MMSDGRKAVVFVSLVQRTCGACGGQIALGDRYTVRKVRRDGRLLIISSCLGCDPLREADWGEVERGSAGPSPFRSFLRCGYCEARRPSVKIRRRLDPRTLATIHEMPLCADCALESGYVEVNPWK